MLMLYYSPGACSFAVHVALLENNIPHETTKVDIHSYPHVMQSGAVFATINPKNYVPVIQLDNKATLTEAAAILCYIADNSHNSKHVNPADPFANYRLQEALTFISSELHKTIGTFFNKQISEEYKEILRDKIQKRFDFLESVLEKQEYLVGNEFGVADAYCFAILRWLNVMDIGVSLSGWEKLHAYYNKIAERPKVKEAFAAEGLSH